MVLQGTTLDAAASVLHTSIAHVAKPTATSAHTHTQYVIRVSDDRYPGLHWTVYRRYSEFRVFKLRLEEAVKQGDMCTHCSIMAKRTCFMQFPPRRLFWNTKESVLESRRIGLNAFLDAIVKHARACRESVTCQTRPLMDQFLMVNDMRYTFLNVNMSEQDLEYIGKLSLNATRDSVSNCGSTASHRSSFASTSTQSTSSKPDQDDLADGALLVPEPNQEEQENRPTLDSHFEGRVLTGRKSSLGSLLDYSRDRSSRSSRNSYNEETHASVPQSSGRLSDWEVAKYQTSTGGRHSDPGSRNDLLGFAGCSSVARRSDQRSRHRRVHLSSAAKRVKKLEEEEARFSCRPPTRQKKVKVLETIPECEE
ncbi:hypothetical protein ATCC90586_002079 [Pythium insidiosum]|nr:hypothetical protein ATCC90586_002079 [Pythium insidiosum]